MTIDSRRKGAVAEGKARDELRKATGYVWERIPGSGALDAKHGLKGDLYIPKLDNRFCVEVKHYKDDQLTSKLLSSKSPTFHTWWEQAVRQAGQVDKEPLLIFKYDRSKWFIAFKEEVISPLDHYLSYSYKEHYIHVCLLTEFCLKMKKEQWLKQSTS